MGSKDLRLILVILEDKNDRTAKELMAKKTRCYYRKSSRGMLPKNKLGRAILKNYLCTRADHPHAAQKPAEPSILINMESINTIGRRKASVARVYLSKGRGNIIINGKDYKDYFPQCIFN